MKQTVCLMLLLIAGSINAQGVIDLLHNTRYEFQNRVIKPEIDKPWLRDEMEFTCYHFTDESTPALKKLNAAMVALCTAQLQTEDRYVRLEREAVLRLEVHDEIFNSQNTGNYGKAGRPHLKHIACEIISIAAGKAVIEMSYSFEYSTPNRYGGRLDVKQYYLGDIASGIISLWKPVVTAANNMALRNMIKDTFNEQYLAGTNKILQDNGGQGNNTVAAAGNIFEKIDLRYADFYWYKAGLMVQFQEYAPGTQVFGGRFFRLFFPYEKALQITALLPEFAYYNNLPKVRHNFRNFNPDDINAMTSVLRSAPTAENFFQNYKGVKTLKSLTIINNQINDDGSIRLMGNQRFSFDAGGRLVSSISTDDTVRPGDETTYIYNPTGQLQEFIKTDYWKKVSTRRYSYDSFGNLSGSVVMDPYATETQYYFYNGSHVYAYTHTLFAANRNEYTRAFEFTGSKLCFDELCYEINADSAIAGLLSTAGINSQQLGFDAGGRLVESHFDHDRDNYYFYYDDANRFIKMQYYSGSAKKQETIFYYEGTGTMPKRIFKDWNNTKTEQLLGWEFYE